MHNNVKNKEQRDNWVLVRPGLFDYPVPEGQRPALFANQCKACSAVFFPKRELCSNCFDQGELFDRTISGQGTIYASSVIHIPSPSGIRPPYACGYVDMMLDDGAGEVRLFALFDDADPRKISCGQKVNLTIGEIRRDEQGRAVIGHIFQPVDGD